MTTAYKRDAFLRNKSCPWIMNMKLQKGETVVVGDFAPKLAAFWVDGGKAGSAGADSLCSPSHALHP